MSLKNSVGDILFRAIAGERISLHNAIKVQKYVDLYLRREQSKSSQFAARGIINNLLSATAPGAKSVWASVLFPAELLYPFEIYPLTLEVIGAIFSTLGLSPALLDKADAVGIPNTMCSFHRMIFGLSSFNILNRPLFIGATSTMCDGNVKSFAEVAREQGVPFLFIDVPFEFSEEGVRYVKGQLKKTLDQTSDIVKVKCSEDSLRDMVLNTNEAFREARRHYALRTKSNKNVVRGYEIANFAFPMHFLLGSRKLVDVLKEKCFDIEVGTRRNKFFDKLYFDKNIFRIMWLHVVPQYDTDIWGIIDNGRDSRIICDEYSSPYYDDYDPEDPLGSIAKRLINHPSNGPLSRRIKSILKIAGDFNVDGVIHYSSWGCHQAAGNVQILGKAIEGAGYKFLNLNGDAVDQRNTSFEQHRTRLEAFLEGN